jgi:hypothetical protein
MASRPESEVWETLSNETNDVARGNTEKPSGRAPKSGRRAPDPEPMPLPDTDRKPSYKDRGKKQKLLMPYLIAGLGILAAGAGYGIYHFAFKSPSPGPGDNQPGPGGDSTRVTVSRKEGGGQYQRVKDALENAREGQVIVIADSTWEEELTIGREISKRLKGVVLQGGADNRGTIWRVREGQTRQKIIEITDAAGLTIRNLTFEGNKDTSFGLKINGVCPGLTIEDVTIRDLKEADIRFDNCKGTPSEPVVVQRCRFIGNQAFVSPACGIAFGDSQSDPNSFNESIIVRDCRFEGPFSKDNREGAINFARGGVGVELTHNRLWKTGDGIYFKEARPGISYKVKVANNTFHSLGVGIRLKNAGYFAQRQNAPNFKIEVERNYFFNVNALSRSDDKFDAASGTPLNSPPQDNARNNGSKEALPSLNSVPREPETPIGLDIDDDRAFLRFPKSSKLNGPPIVGAGPAGD